MTAAAAAAAAVPDATSAGESVLGCAILTIAAFTLRDEEGLLCALRAQAAAVRVFERAQNEEAAAPA